MEELAKALNYLGYDDPECGLLIDIAAARLSGQEPPVQAVLDEIESIAGEKIFNYISGGDYGEFIATILQSKEPLLPQQAGTENI